MSSYSSVSITVDDSDPRDSSARCDRCGRQGTVTRVVRHSEPPEIFRYCSSCSLDGQEALARRQAEEQEEYLQAHRAWIAERPRNPEREPSTPPGWSTASRSWQNVQKLLGLISGLTGEGDRGAIQAHLAAEIRDTAAEMDGPMPTEVRAFLAKHLPASK